MAAEPSWMMRKAIILLFHESTYRGSFFMHILPRIPHFGVFGPQRAPLFQAIFPLCATQQGGFTVVVLVDRSI